MAHEQVVPELSKFNAEINLTPQKLDAEVLTRTHADLDQFWKQVQAGCRAQGLRAVTVGSLPTLRDRHLGIEYLSNRERYRALNQQVMNLRHGHPIRLDIEGKEHLKVFHNDVMLEASATSLQCHLQVEFDRIVDYYNASFLASPFLVAVSANSPYLFGHDLWDETRIPIFEQAVRLPSFSDPDGVTVSRVDFGSGYVRSSLLELFLENLDAYPILIPFVSDGAAETLAHVRLHNGNIWRWNRPIVDVDGPKPHLRIEQRVFSSGPTRVDIVANHALFLGLTHWLSQQVAEPEELVPFSRLRANFYEAARHGIAARVRWIDERDWDMQELLLSTVLPGAREGLEDLGIRESDIRKYLDDVIVPRVLSGRTGASWQRAYVSVHGKDFQKLLARYFELQEKGNPVHTWTV